MSVRFLGLEEVIALHAEQIELYGGATGIRDLGLLESAVASPEVSFDGRYLHATLPEMAAAYLFHLAQNHPFVDGNKRIALTIAAIFLELNGFTLNAPEAEAVIVYQQLAAGGLEEAALADWLRDSSIANA